MATSDPPGFRRHRTRTGTLVVHVDFLEAALALGFPDPPRVEACFTQHAQAAVGRQASARVTLPGRSERLHLRRVRHGGLLAPLWRGRVLGLGRPVEELRVTERLRERGAPVPRAALVAGWRDAPFWSAVYASVHLEDTRDALAWLAAGPASEDVRRVAAAAGHAVRAFHEAGGHHADLHLKNLLVDDVDRVFVIDLDKASSGAAPTPRRRMQELMRLYRSLLKRGVFETVGSEGRSAFLEAYTDGDDALRAALLAHWPRERRRVARHALGYRQPG